MKHGRTDAIGAPDDPEAFTRWVQPHWHGMAVLARRLVGPPDWEDVLQDALLAAWRSRSSFNPGCGSARNWLLQIVANRARTWGSTVRPLPVAELPECPSDAAAAPDVDLERAVAALPERQRLAVGLHYFVGLPVADVAAVMDCSVGTVKSTLSDARAGLRSRLGGDQR